MDIKTQLMAAVSAYEGSENRCLVLDAARNIMSPAVRAILASRLTDCELSGRVEAYGDSYAAAPIRAIQEITRSLVMTLFGASHAELRASSGSMANGLASLAITEPGDAILMPPEWVFGHKSLGRGGYPGTSGRRVLEMPWDCRSLGPDLEGLRRILQKERPRLVTLGVSRHIFPEPMSEVAGLAREIGAKLLYDGAHVLGLIAGGVFPNPLSHGFDLLTASTYKTVAGPHGGIIICRDPADLDSVANLCDGWVSTYDHNRVAALACALCEMVATGTVYARDMVENAQTLARHSAAEGFRVIGADHGFTATHQVLLDITDRIEPTEATKRLWEANVLVRPPTHADRRLRMECSDGWWLRLGTSAVTRLGMGKDQMQTIALILARILLHRQDPAAVAVMVADLMAGFDTVRYALGAA